MSYPNYGNDIFIDSTENYTLQPIQMVDERTELARLMREKKNNSVRKSRFKSRQNAIVTEMQIHRLTVDNQELSQHIHGLQYELARLKSAFQQQSMQDTQTLTSLINYCKN